MQEQIKTYTDKINQGWKNTSPKIKKWIYIGLVVALIIAALVLGINMLRPYATLFTGLNQEDMSNVVSYLSDNGITDYRIQGNDTVLVPQSQAAQLKADLLMQGYPSSGFGYSTYLDNVGALSTESERSMLELYSLQDEMEAVIKHFDFVSDAQVIIVPGQDNTYVLDSGNIMQASASVMVTMSGNATLSGDQVKAIRDLVSRAVQGLEIENISITDTLGNSYSTSDDATSLTQSATALKLELEREVNNTVRTNIAHVLEPLFGTENFRISVNSVVDMDRSVTDTTNYTLEEWAQDGSTDGEGILGSQVYDQQIIRQNEDEEGGAVGTTTNSDINTYVEDEALQDPNLDQINNYGEENYLVDTTKSQSESLGGTVADLTVSITVNSEASAGMDANELYDLVARAAGISSEIQQEKIDIMIAPFFEEETTIFAEDALIQEWMIIPLIALAAFLFIMLIIIILISRRRKKKRRKQAEEDMANATQTAQAQLLAKGFDMSTNPALAGLSPQEISEQMVDIMDIRSDRSVELRKTVREFAKNNPEIAAQMVKNWLKEGT